MKRIYKIALSFLLIFISCNSYKLSKNKVNTDDYIFLEAEETESDLQNWKIINKGDKYYVKGASNNSYLEFMGNKPITGKANSPLEYHFAAPKSGNFKLMLMSSKRLEGVKSDWCNDAFVKLSGDFESANTFTTQDLEKDIKILQDGNDETEELAWHWASTAEKDRHVYNDFVYQLKKGEKYTLTLSGRSMRFSIDYIVLYNIDKIDHKKAKQLFIIKQ
jgi:hypothetical protein